MSLRLLAKQLLSSDAGATYVERELINCNLEQLRAPADGAEHHIYCCSHLNPGAEVHIRGESTCAFNPLSSVVPRPRLTVRHWAGCGFVGPRA